MIEDCGGGGGGGMELGALGWISDAKDSKLDFENDCAFKIGFFRLGGGAKPCQPMFVWFLDPDFKPPSKGLAGGTTPGIIFWANSTGAFNTDACFSLKGLGLSRG